MSEHLDAVVLPHPLHDAADCAILVLTPELRVREWNRGAERLYRRSADEVRGQSYVDLLVAPSDRARFARQLATGGADPGASLHAIVMPDGRQRWVLWSASHLQGAVLAIVQDVDERERERRTARDAAAQVVEETQRRITTLMSNLPGMAYRCGNAPHRPLAFASDGARGVTGYAAEELIAPDPPHLGDLVLPHDRERLWDAIQDALRERRRFTIEYRIATKDGSIHTVWEQGIGIHRPDGTLDAIEGFITDVTERAEAQSSARHREARLAALIATTQDAVVALDAHAHITLFNDAAERLFGFAREDVLGRKVNILMPQRYASEHDGYIERYERTGEAHAIGRIRTVTGRRKNGDEFPMELSVTEIKIDEETRYAALIRDISEKVRLQQELVGRERMVAIGTAAAKCAHEIGNPLNGMSVNAQLVRRWLRKAEPAVEDRIVQRIDAILGDIGRLTELLDEFRSLSRRERFITEPTDLEAMIDDILAAESEMYEARQVHTQREIPSDLPHPPADATKLRRALFNLCKNAVEAMPDGGTLCLRAERTDRGVALEISDTGIGIPDDINVFEPFATSKATGTGLGLAIVRQIIESHRGTIRYETEPGRGTTFRIELPA